MPSPPPLFSAISAYTCPPMWLNLGTASRELHHLLDEVIRQYKIARAQTATTQPHGRAVLVELRLVVRATED